eukprot:444668-Pleurochrysis_carterae.AAC.5
MNSLLPSSYSTGRPELVKICCVCAFRSVFTRLMARSGLRSSLKGLRAREQKKHSLYTATKQCSFREADLCRLQSTSSYSAQIVTARQHALLMTFDKQRVLVLSLIRDAHAR